MEELAEAEACCLGRHRRLDCHHLPRLRLQLRLLRRPGRRLDSGLAQSQGCAAEWLDPPVVGLLDSLPLEAGWAGRLAPLGH
jgi:hypothetical protein